VTIAVGHKGLLCVYPKRVAEFALAKFPKSAFAACVLKTLPALFLFIISNPATRRPGFASVPQPNRCLNPRGNVVTLGLYGR
jgi:hypothetical protein